MQARRNYYTKILQALLSVRWASLLPQKFIHTVLYFPAICSCVSVASPRFALLYSCNAQTQGYNIIAFRSVTTFATKKQKKCRYPHTIHILIHILCRYRQLSARNCTTLLTSGDECNVCESKRQHPLYYVRRGVRTRANECDVPRRKGTQ